MSPYLLFFSHQGKIAHALQPNCLLNSFVYFPKAKKKRLISVPKEFAEGENDSPASGGAAGRMRPHHGTSAASRLGLLLALRPGREVISQTPFCWPEKPQPNNPILVFRRICVSTLASLPRLPRLPRPQGPPCSSPLQSH